MAIERISSRVQDLTINELSQVYNIRLKNTINVDQPLVLISQIARSGGTLLSQLFDMHPECHVHPHELKLEKNLLFSP